MPDEAQAAEGSVDSKTLAKVAKQVAAEIRDLGFGGKEGAVDKVPPIKLWLWVKQFQLVDLFA